MVRIHQGELIKLIINKKYKIIMNRLKKLNFSNLANFCQNNKIFGVDLKFYFLNKEALSEEEKGLKLIRKTLTFENIVNEKLFKLKTIQKVGKCEEEGLNIHEFETGKQFSFQYGKHWFFVAIVEGSFLFRGKNFFILRESSGIIRGFQTKKGKVPGLKIHKS